MRFTTPIALLALFIALPVVAQQPRVNTFFPIGGKAGSTVEVEIRGANLAGAEKLFVSGGGVTGTVNPGNAKPDETNRPLWQGKCQGCHELRSPANRSLTPAQWAATVRRMVEVRQAPISPDETAKITEFLVGLARAGRVTAQIQIAPDALPGLRELRVVTARGLSTAALFEVGNLLEVTAANGSRADAPPITLPCVANGTFAGNGERHWFRFAAKQGQRLVFNLRAFRYDDQTQTFFNPVLSLHDASGHELATNHGYYELDPLIDWTCPQDGDYTLQVRDMLGRGNPGSVYRLTMGPVPYDTVLYPPGAQAKTKATLSVAGKNMGAAPAAYTLDVPDTEGIVSVGSPFGPQRLRVTPYPVVRDEGASAAPVALPVGFGGRIGKPGEADTFTVRGSGACQFQVSAGRLGAEGVPRVTLLQADGKGVGGRTGEGSFAATLKEGENYTLKVEEANGKGGPEFVYFVEAEPVQPEVRAFARGANTTLRPGTTAAVEIVLGRKERAEGDVVVTADGLPNGVTAAPLIISPDRNRGWLLLTAASDAAPIEKAFRITLTARGPGGVVRCHVLPQEEYRINNQERYAEREECTLAVRGATEFTGELVLNTPLRLHPKKVVEVKARIARRNGFKGAVVVTLRGLPQGWVCSRETIPADKDEVLLKVRPDGNSPEPFLKRDPKLAPIRPFLEATAEEFNFVLATVGVERAPNWDKDED